MMIKRLVIGMVCMVLLLTFSTVHSEGLLASDLTNYMLFDMIFRDAASASAIIEGVHVFRPLYSGGHWVRTYYTGGPAYMQVLTTSPGPQGSVVAVNVISDGEESPLYRELCGYAMEGLVLAISDKTPELLGSDAALHEIADEIGVDSVGYVFSIKEDGTVPYASLETTNPYVVDERIDIPTEERAMYPLPADTISVKSFVERLEGAIKNNYAMEPISIEHLETSKGDGAEWLHIYVAMDMILMIVAEGETEEASVKNISILDIQGNPALLTMLGEASFGALAGFDAEQFAAMGLLSGARTTFNDFLSFLPTVAYDQKMLLFGMSGEYGGAYIMGTP